MTELQKILYRELYKKSFYEYVKAFWQEADPTKFVDGKLVQFYCEVFQYFCRDWVPYTEIDVTLPKKSKNVDVIDVREGKRNLCLNVPPRHSKSMIFNVLGPTWLWANYPIKAVSVSHTSGLSGDMNMKRQKCINSQLYKSLFTNVNLTSNSNSFLKDDRGGELYSVNRNAFTGYGGDVIINDDLTNAETARKDKEEMNNAWNYYQNTMPSRINDINKCFIANIQQRLAPNDITAHIMNDKKLSEQYTFIVLPAQFEKETYLVCPISGDIIHYKKGDYLWPERFGNYETLRAQVGESVFQTQYLQHAIASDRTVVKDNMIIEKDACDVPDISQADMIYASHDFPVKDKESSDFLGSTLAYRVGSTLYFIDCLEKRMAFVKSVEYVRQLDDVYPGILQIIEDKANGSPIIQQLQDEVSGLQAFQPGSQSKMQRLESASLYMHSKNVVFVKSNFDKMTNQYSLPVSLQVLRQRLLSFPFVEHDDIVDSFSMMILFVFMDKRYMVYGRAFNDENIIDTNSKSSSYSTIFFNKEGDVWKICEIIPEYGETTKLIVKNETRVKGSVEEGMRALKKFAPDKKVFIDCSATPALNGIYDKSTIIEKYDINDFDKSVAQTNLAFSKNLILINKTCNLIKSDIESFKFAKSKDETVKYLTTKDGFVACIRTALSYFGGIV